MNDPRPCERHCPGCNEWKHHSRFRSRKRRTPHGTVWEFNPTCKACEQKERNERKNEDRPLAIMRRRAQDRSRRSGVSFDFIWIQMNYQALVPIYRVLCSPEARCLSCGHPFDNERDIQIEHIDPPRHAQDWARLHARNLHFLCGSCNRTKTNRDHNLWLDDSEDTRLSNASYREIPAEMPPTSSQPTLF